jgi:HSP20 family molecular chaperone IbpA
MDAYRRGDQYLIHLDLPGVDPDAIELTPPAPVRRTLWWTG